MVNILLLSHSKKLVEGLKEILDQIATNTIIEISGGTFDGEIGSNFEEIMEKMSRLANDGGVVVLFDMGSSVLNAQTAYEMLDDEEKKNVILADTSMVESSVQIAVMAESGQSLAEIKEFTDKNRLNKLD